VFGADGEGQLVLCDMKGLRDVTEEGEEFAAYLAGRRPRSLLHWGFEMATGRASAPTPDVVFLVLDGEKLSSMTDENAARLLEPYGVHGQGALKKPPAIPDRGDHYQDGQGPGSGHQGHEVGR
jgi:hypothetical protein